MSGKLINLGVRYRFAERPPLRYLRYFAQGYDDHVNAWHLHRVRHLALHTALSMEQADRACRLVPSASLEALEALAYAGLARGHALWGFEAAHWATTEHGVGSITGRAAPEEDDDEPE